MAPVLVGQAGVAHRVATVAVVRPSVGDPPGARINRRSVNRWRHLRLPISVVDVNDVLVCVVGDPDYRCRVIPPKINPADSLVLLRDRERIYQEFFLGYGEHETAADRGPTVLPHLSLVRWVRREDLLHHGLRKVSGLTLHNRLHLLGRIVPRAVRQGLPWAKVVKELCRGLGHPGLRRVGHKDRTLAVEGSCHGLGINLARRLLV